MPIFQALLCCTAQIYVALHNSMLHCTILTSWIVSLCCIAPIYVALHKSMLRCIIGMSLICIPHPKKTPMLVLCIYYTTHIQTKNKKVCSSGGKIQNKCDIFITETPPLCLFRARVGGIKYIKLTRLAHLHLYTTIYYYIFYYILLYITIL